VKVVELTYDIKLKPFPETSLQVSEEEAKALARKVIQRLEAKMFQAFGVCNSPVRERALGVPCWPWADYIRWGNDREARDKENQNVLFNGDW